MTPTHLARISEFFIMLFETQPQPGDEDDHEGFSSLEAGAQGTEQLRTQPIQGAPEPAANHMLDGSAWKSIAEEHAGGLPLVEMANETGADYTLSMDANRDIYINGANRTEAFRQEGNEERLAYWDGITSNLMSGGNCHVEVTHVGGNIYDTNEAVSETSKERMEERPEVYVTVYYWDGTTVHTFCFESVKDANEESTDIGDDEDGLNILEETSEIPEEIIQSQEQEVQNNSFLRPAAETPAVTAESAFGTEDQQRKTEATTAEQANQVDAPALEIENEIDEGVADESETHRPFMLFNAKAEKPVHTVPKAPAATKEAESPQATSLQREKTVTENSAAEKQNQEKQQTRKAEGAQKPKLETTKQPPEKAGPKQIVKVQAKSEKQKAQDNKAKESEKENEPETIIAPIIVRKGTIEAKIIRVRAQEKPVAKPAAEPVTQRLPSAGSKEQSTKEVKPAHREQTTGKSEPHYAHTAERASVQLQEKISGQELNNATKPAEAKVQKETAAPLAIKPETIKLIREKPQTTSTQEQTSPEGKTAIQDKTAEKTAEVRAEAPELQTHETDAKIETTESNITVKAGEANTEAVEPMVAVQAMEESASSHQETANETELEDLDITVEDTINVAETSNTEIEAITPKQTEPISANAAERRGETETQKAREKVATPNTASESPARTVTNAPETTKTALEITPTENEIKEHKTEQVRQKEPTQEKIGAPRAEQTAQSIKLVIEVKKVEVATQENKAEAENSKAGTESSIDPKKEIQTIQINESMPTAPINRVAEDPKVKAQKSENGTHEEQITAEEKNIEQTIKRIENSVVQAVKDKAPEFETTQAERKIEAVKLSPAPTIKESPVIKVKVVETVKAESKTEQETLRTQEAPKTKKATTPVIKLRAHDKTEAPKIETTKEETVKEAREKVKLQEAKPQRALEPKPVLRIATTKHESKIEKIPAPLKVTAVKTETIKPVKSPIALRRVITRQEPKPQRSTVTVHHRRVAHRPGDLRSLTHFLNARSSAIHAAKKTRATRQTKARVIRFSRPPQQPNNQSQSEQERRYEALKLAA